MPGLLMFYVGGTAPGANIELHDVQFAAADRPEEAYPLLREKWFGDKRRCMSTAMRASTGRTVTT